MRPLLPHLPACLPRLQYYINQPSFYSYNDAYWYGDDTNWVNDGSCEVRLLLRGNAGPAASSVIPLLAAVCGLTTASGRHLPMDILRAFIDHQLPSLMPASNAPPTHTPTQCDRIYFKYCSQSPCAGGDSYTETQVVTQAVEAPAPAPVEATTQAVDANTFTISLPFFGRRLLGACVCVCEHGSFSRLLPLPHE